MKIYHYAACGTCKKAKKWLEARKIEAEWIPIVEQPPSKSELKKVLRITGLPARKLFNTSGVLYREGDYKNRDLSDEEILDELAAQGKLIKRPLLIAGDQALVGFKEADYEKAFG